MNVLHVQITGVMSVPYLTESFRQTFLRIAYIVYLISLLSFSVGLIIFNIFNELNV